MQIEDMLKNINPQTLKQALGQMQTMLSPEQMRQVEANLKQGNLGQRLNQLSLADLEQELRSNPALANQLKQNPEVMKKINQMFQGR